MLKRFPHLNANGGKRFYFGQNLAEAEEIFGRAGRENPPEIARVRPSLRIIETNEVILTFDAGKLSNMEFLRDYDFEFPLAPYAEEWKNLNGLDFRKDTTRAEATGYLSNWEKRVSALGARKMECGENLSSSEFSTYSSDDDDDVWLKTLGIAWDVLGINMGKSRRAGGGGLWTDGWIIEFKTAADAKLDQLPIGKLYRISAFCDEFNTAARQ